MGLLRIILICLMSNQGSLNSSVGLYQRFFLLSKKRKVLIRHPQPLFSISV